MNLLGGATLSLRGTRIEQGACRCDCARVFIYSMLSSQHCASCYSMPPLRSAGALRIVHHRRVQRRYSFAIIADGYDLQSTQSLAMRSVCDVLAVWTRDYRRFSITQGRAQSNYKTFTIGIVRVRHRRGWIHFQQPPDTLTSSPHNVRQCGHTRVSPAQQARST